MNQVALPFPFPLPLLAAFDSYLTTFFFTLPVSVGVTSEALS